MTSASVSEDRPVRSIDTRSSALSSSREVWMRSSRVCSGEISLGVELSFTLGLRLRVDSLVKSSGSAEALGRGTSYQVSIAAAAEPLLVHGYNPANPNYHRCLTFARCGFYANASRLPDCGGAHRG